MTDEHFIALRIDDGYVGAVLVCVAPQEAACRLSCPNGCAQVVVCGRGHWLCEDGHPKELHCGSCEAVLKSLEPGDCHVVNWIDDVADGYAGPARTFRIPVEIDWEEDGATWSLPEKPTVSEETR